MWHRKGTLVMAAAAAALISLAAVFAAQAPRTWSVSQAYFADLHAQLLARHSPVPAPLPGRVVAVDLPPVMRSQVRAPGQP